MPYPQLRVSFAVRCQLLAELLSLTGMLAGLAFFFGLPGAALWAAGGGLVLCFLVWIWTGRTITCGPGALIFKGSVWLDTVRVLPRHSILGLMAAAPPLLRLAGCRVVMVSTFTGRVWLPGLSLRDTCTLLHWYQKAD